MAITDGFIAQIKEQLRRLGTITVRKMFGGAGIYCNGLIIAIANDDVLYFKVDDATRDTFEVEGTGPFRYPLKDGVQVMNSYWRVPERLFDDEDEMLVWARRALDASHAASSAKGKPQTKPASKQRRRLKA